MPRLVSPYIRGTLGDWGAVAVTLSLGVVALLVVLLFLGVLGALGVIGIALVLR